MQLNKSDIQSIGNTVHPNSVGGTSFICTADNSGVEGILLREILKMFSASIVDVRDFTWSVKGEPGQTTDVEFVTDLSWKDYQNAV